MKKLNFLIILFVLLAGLSVVKTVHADAAIDNGLNFLRSKQDANGRINTGFSAPSQWSAIAFTANGIDISTVKNPSVSLQDFLVSDIPSEPSAATDWETRILAIVATNGNPTNYGNVNYVTHLESFYDSTNKQMGDICSLNDDIFGLLAEVAAGSAANTQIKQAVLDYLILNQDSNDGGFGYSTPGCKYYSTAADMTSAAIQALVAAKNAGLTNPNLDNVISRAKNYLLANQDSDGGFGYYGSSDTDTSGWVLMAFNVLSMQDSSQSANLKNWLISQQSAADDGILAYDYGLNSSVSNATTTAQALIGLAGKSWILKIFDSSSAITPSPIVQTPTPTPTPDTSSNSTSVTPTPTPTVTPVPTDTPTPTSTPEVLAQADNSSSNNAQPTAVTEVTPTPEAAVLGAKAPIVLNANTNKNVTNSLFVIIFTVLGLFFTFTYLIRMFIMGRKT